MVVGADAPSGGYGAGVARFAAVEESSVPLDW